MPERKPFKLEKYEFLVEGKGPSPLSNMGVTPVRPPVIEKGKSRLWFNFPTLSELGAAIGFDDETSQYLLSYHERRRKRRGRISGFLYFLFISIVLLVLSFFSYRLFTEDLLPVICLLEGPKIVCPDIATVIFIFIPVGLVLYALYLVLIVICFKIAFILTDKYFADTLCVMTIIYLIIELSHKDALVRPAHRKHVLQRIHYLARDTLLMPLHYFSKSGENQHWAQKHFKNLELYIRERERWAIAPKETTLAELREDFYKLVPLYLAGNYGEFQWLEIEAPKEIPLTRKQRLLSALPRVMGFLVPMLVLGYFVWRPEQLKASGLNNVVAIIFIAWVLLTIDTVLRLGVVASLVNLAKGIKDLK